MFGVLTLLISTQPAAHRQTPTTAVMPAVRIVVGMRTVMECAHSTKWNCAEVAMTVAGCLW